MMNVCVAKPISVEDIVVNGVNGENGDASLNGGLINGGLMIGLADGALGAMELADCRRLHTHESRQMAYAHYP